MTENIGTFTRYLVLFVSVCSIVGMILPVRRFAREAKMGIASGVHASLKDFVPAFYPVTKIIYVIIAASMVRGAVGNGESASLFLALILLGSLGVTSLVQGWVLSRLLGGLMKISPLEPARKRSRYAFVVITATVIEVLAVFPFLLAIFLLNGGHG